MLLLLERD